MAYAPFYIWGRVSNRKHDISIRVRNSGGIIIFARVDGGSEEVVSIYMDTERDGNIITMNIRLPNAKQYNWAWFGKNQGYIRFNRFDIVDAYYVYSMDYGEHVTLARLTDKLRYTPSPKIKEKGYHGLSKNAKKIYHNLVVRHYSDLARYKG